MTRLERVRKFAKEHYRNSLEAGIEPGVDAQTVSDALSIHRSDASSDLNQLWREGILIKTGKRPVKFLPAGEAQASTREAPQHMFSPSKTTKTDPKSEPKNFARDVPAFAGVIGANGSIKAQIQLAKAAVAYPPMGLHTLIVGESGVGKSLLAEEMWRYGVGIGTFEPSAGNMPPFVLFSCADFADNPQLLLSELFGHAKGAFTGANEEKAGLVECAEEGVLFLDEIHRLPPTGQELFFTLLDKGTYRRLGDTRDRSANIMIIAATTEDPNSVLLTTFRRRIPVLIKLPKLSARPLGERLSLIEYFLIQEANRLQLPIWVSGRALQILVSYNCRANIGDLKNDLQLCCAKSYLSYLSGHEFRAKGQGPDSDRHGTLAIDIHDLPQKVYSAVNETEALDNEHLSEVFEDGLVVQPGKTPVFETITNDYEIPIDLYGFVERRLDAYKYHAMRQEELESVIGRDLERYYSAAVQALHGRHDDFRGVSPGIITPVAMNIATDILAEASKRLGRRYSRSLLIALAIHLQQFMGRAKAGQIIYNPHLQHIKTHYAAEMEVVQSAIPGTFQRLGVSVPEDEIGFLAMFLTQPSDQPVRPKIGLIVAAHGRATASSMAEVANHLLSTNHIRSVDAPLNRSLGEIFDALCQVIVECDQGKGVLIVADMGSFVEMEEDLFRKTGVQCRVIPNASTTLVLEAGKVVLTSDADLSESVQSIVLASQTYVRALWNPILQRDTSNSAISPEHSWPDEHRKVGTRGAVIAICPSGIGTAGKIKDILLENLPIARVMDIVQLSVLDDVSAVADRLGKRLRLVVGSIDPGLSGVPYVSIDKVLSEQGLKEIDVLLKGWYEGQSPSGLPGNGDSREEAFMLLSGQMNRFAPSLDSDEVMKQCRFILEEIESRIYHRHMPVDLIVGVVLHAACMFERLARGKSLPMPEQAERTKQQRKNMFDLLRPVLIEATSGLGLSISESEVIYFLFTLPENDS